MLRILDDSVAIGATFFRARLFNDAEREREREGDRERERRREKKSETEEREREPVNEWRIGEPKERNRIDGGY